MIVGFTPCIGEYRYGIRVFDQVWDLGQCMIAPGSGLVSVSYIGRRSKTIVDRLGYRCAFVLVLDCDDNLE